MLSMDYGRIPNGPFDDKTSDEKAKGTFDLKAYVTQSQNLRNSFGPKTRISLGRNTGSFPKEGGSKSFRIRNGNLHDPQY